MKQLFEVGEHIILDSQSHPEYNGEYVIETIVTEANPHTCRFTANKMHPDIDFAYVLDVPMLSKTTEREVLWKQSALRKKHRPSELSFSQLMNTLKSPTKERAK